MQGEMSTSTRLNPCGARYVAFYQTEDRGKILNTRILDLVENNDGNYPNEKAKLFGVAAKNGIPDVQAVPKWPLGGENGRW
ncbi:hypothetical protein BLNAU_24963 [Blattamonas nauphoetae]|uniref:Uncharacterized protein n=1 Tax=Blattamonas nauphoetae TaxID=2049346 RepID=A0ABQ9WKY6_9EUKA|nr:hypothetical protein BLNAU_24963 [Blattamonas nauphoetae]